MPDALGQSAARLAAVASLFTLILGGATSGPAAAQQAALLHGTVVDEVTGKAVPSARVSLVGTGLESRTAADGTFSFLDAPVGRVSVRVQAAGYPAVVEEVEMLEGSERFLSVTLPQVGALLRELVVIAKADRSTDANTAADLLQREIGDVLRPVSIVGKNDSELLLRGLGSVMLSNEPTIFLDGVRMSGNPMDILRQIPADDVKDIQVFRGAATAFVQDGANGAIFIRTKRGPDEEH